MSKLKIQGKELRAIGYPEGPVISVAMHVMEYNTSNIIRRRSIRNIERSIAITGRL